jgi:predicted nucleotidyltransferase
VALARHREEVATIIREAGGENPRVFGSVAKGLDTPDSDIDLLVDFRRGVGVFTIAGVWRRLIELLGHEVDLIPSDGLRPRLAHILEEAVPL